MEGRFSGQPRTRVHSPMQRNLTSTKYAPIFHLFYIGMEDRDNKMCSMSIILVAAMAGGVIECVIYADNFTSIFYSDFLSKIYPVLLIIVHTVYNLSL